MRKEIKHSLAYRPEIDGLRALAVLPVILFHAGVGPFAGGFVGVDIFFVLSGYLITSIILKDLANDQFSLTQFYVRRARRILPALIVMLAICLPVAFWLMLPEELKRFGQSMMAVATFSSNVFFWWKTDYFAPAAELQPLLHTWSLAVEEQYYVFMPLLLAVVWRHGFVRIGAVIGAAAIASFIFASILHDTHPQTAFYFLPTRAWELLVGSLVAVAARTGTDNIWAPRSSQAGSLTGLGMILWALFTFEGRTPTTPAAMLVPVLGTALVIHTTGGRTLVASLLSCRPLVGLGLISYSAYLWHQPVFAFARLHFFDAATPELMGALVLVSLACGYVSWRFVEIPTRTATWPVLENRSLMLCGSGGLLFTTLVLGLVLHATSGFGSLRRWDGINDALQASAERASGERFCHAHPVASPLGVGTCVIGDQRAKVDGVLWGDSLAGALLPGLHEELLARQRAFVAVLSDGCIPIEGAARTVKKEFNCNAGRHASVVQSILQQNSIKTLVWIGDFRLLTSGERSDYVIDGVPTTPELVSEQMLATLHKLAAAGKDVVLIGNPPRFPIPTADYAMRMYARGHSDPALQSQHVKRADLERAYGTLEAVLTQGNVAGRVINGLDVFCNGQDCSSHDEYGRLLYTDENHFSHRGARKLAQVILKDEGSSGIALTNAINVSGEPRARHSPSADVRPH